MARRMSRPGMLAGAAAAAVLAFPAVASANVTATVTAGALTVTGQAGDGIAITCVANQVKVNGQDPAPATACDAITSIAVTGGDGANVIDLSGVTDRDDAVNTDYPAITSVTRTRRPGASTCSRARAATTRSSGTRVMTATRWTAATAPTRSRSTAAAAASSSPSSPPRRPAACSSIAPARLRPARSASTSARPSGSI